MQKSGTKSKSSVGQFFVELTRKPIFIPIVALLLLAIFNLIMDPGFYAIALNHNSEGYPVLSGSLITILDNGSELAILAIGMTLVTAATGGQDISVGAAVAFNGVLVAFFKIQPMVATLILYTAGRNIAAWINQNRLPIVSEPSFGYFGGTIPGIPIPTPFFIAAICVVIIALVLKFTTLGLYVQSVGINENSARLNGLNPKLIKILTFVILGLCVAVVGLIKVSRISTINYSVVAKDIEMDAILAVALGGNSLAGGKFNMAGSIMGAYTIQFLTTTLYKYNVPSEALPAYKAVVVIVLVVLSAPVVKERLGALGKKLSSKKNTAKEVG